MSTTTNAAAVDLRGEIGLPPLYSVGDFDGEFSEYIEALYAQYAAMVHHADIRLWGKLVTACCSLAPDGRDSRFWHLITAGSSEHTEETRRLNLKRCAHLPRAWDVLERLARDDLRVCWWREGRLLFVAPVNFSMVIVLRERRDIFEIKSAYPTDKPKKMKRWFARAAAAWESDECQHPDARHLKWSRGTPFVLPSYCRLIDAIWAAA